ncbi:MAG: hypothetical protein ACYTEZ_18315 [Planctomycetota bacterium]|jgi:hypothetical protein
MKRITLSILALVFAAVVQAQEGETKSPPATPEAKAPEENAHLLLSTALRAYQSAEDLVVTARVTHEAAQAGAFAGGQMGVVLVQRSGTGPDPFAGAVEGWRAADGTRVLVSESRLPGFELYLREGRTIERTTFEVERFSLDQLKAELAPLLEGSGLARHLLAAKLTPRRDEATGKLTFQGEVSKELVRPTVSDSPLQAMHRVLRIGAEVVVTPQGRLERLAVKITRNDPLREMMRGRMKGIRVQLGGAGAPAPPPDDDEKKHDIEGGTTTYALTFDRQEPSERARAFKREAERLLERQ